MRFAGGIAVAVIAAAACGGSPSSKKHYEFPSVPIERSDAGPEYLPPPPAPEPECPPGATDCGGDARPIDAP